MADQNEFNGGEGGEGGNNQPNKVEERIRDLSGKVKETAEARDAEAKAKAEAIERAAKAEKERDFFKSFSTVTSKYPGAAEYQEKIQEKVMAGYDLEDAAVAILSREGKLGAPRMETKSPVGGSAVTNPTAGAGQKEISQMTQAEKRAILAENLELTP